MSDTNKTESSYRIRALETLIKVAEDTRTTVTYRIEAAKAILQFAEADKIPEEQGSQDS